MTKAIEKLNDINEQLQNEVIDSVVVSLGGGEESSQKLREALEKRQKIMNSSFKEVISVGDYIKVTNPSSPYYKLIGKVLSKKQYVVSSFDYVVTDIDTNEKILISDLEKFY